MIHINGYNISLPYGESFSIKFTLTDTESGDPYFIPAGSLLHFAVHYRMSSAAVIEKTAGSAEQNEDGSVTFSFTSAETKIDRNIYHYTLSLENAAVDKRMTLIGFPDNAFFAVESGCPSGGTSLSQAEIAVGIDISGERLPYYEGSFTIEPSFSDDIVIPTAGKSVEENITVRKAVPQNTFTFSSNGFFCYPENVVVPDTVTSLAGNTARGFTEHAEIKTVTFAENSVITTVPGFAFASCSGLTAIALPASVRQIDQYAFQYCSRLKTFIFNSVPSNIAYMSTSPGNPFYGCVSLEDVQIPPGWTHNLYLSRGAGYENIYTNSLTHDSMVAMIGNLYDFTGAETHRLSLGSTNLARLSEEEKAVAAAKNWTLA